MKPFLSAPTVVNIEITDTCNVRCRHCYNYWREDDTPSFSMDTEMMDKLVNLLVEARVFHAVLSGGEPMSRFEVLEHGLARMVEKNISVSCNSNLMLASDERMSRLAQTGLDHILTSLNSHDPAKNDFIVQQSGAFERIVRGIETARKHGIRVSVNMIVSQHNKDDVYETGKLIHQLGCQKLFGTRLVPPVNKELIDEAYIKMAKQDALHVLDQLAAVKRDFGLMIGTLVSYPLCLLGDLEGFSDFVGRGCPAQAGHRMNINADGQSHACVHELTTYGNVYEIGIQSAYGNMRDWHRGTFRFEGCEGCGYLEICSSGCRMSALAYSGEMNGPDQLMCSPISSPIPSRLLIDEELLRAIDDGLRFRVPSRLRFRQENGFHLVNIRWANTITCPDDIARFLIRYGRSGEPFTLADLGRGNREILAHLFLKDVVYAEDYERKDGRDKLGLSLDPLALRLGEEDIRGTKSQCGQ